MDQRKIGLFLKVLRNEKKLTQEQLAEKMLVSNRTVSRWESGYNMPDLLILMQLADYYEVELREILDGERKEMKMNQEEQNTVLKVADYSNEEKERLTRRMHYLFLLGVVLFVVYLVLDALQLAESGYTGAIASFSLGCAFGMLVVGVIFTSRSMTKIRAFKEKLLQEIR